MDIYQTAIEQRRRLELSYKGSWRSVEPHAYGTSGSGRLLLRCYQVVGDSASGQAEGWKLMKIEEIDDVSLGSEFPASRPGYKPGDRQMTEIIAEL